MADELFHLSPPHLADRLVYRGPRQRRGLDLYDGRKSCGERFLRNLEDAIFARTRANAAVPEPYPAPARETAGKVRRARV